MRSDAKRGPTVAPLRAGLPHTSEIACRELILGILWQAVIDDDREFALTPEFDAYCALVGIPGSAAFAFKIRLMLGVGRARFDSRRLHAMRFEAGEAETFWQSWPTTSPLGR